MCCFWSNSKKYLKTSVWKLDIEPSSLNPVSPNIYIQIPQTDLYTFPSRMCWENLVEDQSIFSWVIILSTLITISLGNVWILLGENWSCSLSGLKGFTLLEYGSSPWQRQTENDDCPITEDIVSPKSNWVASLGDLSVV